VGWHKTPKKILDIPAGETGWQRLTFAGKPPKTRTNLHTLRLSITHPGEDQAVVHVDDLRVSPGDSAAGEGEYAYPVAGAVATGVLGNMFKVGRERPSLDVTLANQSEEMLERAVLLRAFDLWGEKVHEEKLPVL